MKDNREDNSAIVIGFAIVGLSGFIMGLLAGWVFWA